MAKQVSAKHTAISKTNAQMVVIVAVAAFVSVFCLVAANTVWKQIRYQSKVSGAKEKARDQLQKNLEAFNQLTVAYKAFDSTSTNVIGGTTTGSGDNDGPNSKIILNALPPSYDFPALTSSVEKILKDQSVKVANITGTDDELNQQANTSSPTPQPVEMPFSFTVTGANYASVERVISALQRSIRPIVVDSVNLSGGQQNMTVVVNAHTYYQPAKNVSITKQVVKR